MIRALAQGRADAMIDVIDYMGQYMKNYKANLGPWPELINEVLDTIRLLAAEDMPMFIVSHEMAFVREVSSKVVFMANGRVIEVGKAKEIFDAPRQEWIRKFVGKIVRH